MQQAERGMQELLESVDTVIVIPNEKLLAVAKDAGFFESFRIADDVLRQGVQGISDIITIPGVINRDFADVKTTMAGMGYAVMGTGVRSGPNRAVEAAMAAMASPLLEAGAIDGAKGILINITGSSSLKLSEVNEASSIIQNAAHEDANIIFGAVQDETMGDEVKITVIATVLQAAGDAAAPRANAGRGHPAHNAVRRADSAKSIDDTSRYTEIRQRAGDCDTCGFFCTSCPGGRGEGAYSRGAQDRTRSPSWYRFRPPYLMMTSSKHQELAQARQRSGWMQRCRIDSESRLTFRCRCASNRKISV